MSGRSGCTEGYGQSERLRRVDSAEPYQVSDEGHLPRQSCQQPGDQPCDPSHEEPHDHTHDQTYESTYKQTHEQTHDYPHYHSYDCPYDLPHDQTHDHSYDHPHYHPHYHSHDYPKDQTHDQTHDNSHGHPHYNPHYYPHDQTHDQAHGNSYYHSHYQADDHPHDHPYNQLHDHTHYHPHDDPYDKTHNKTHDHSHDHPHYHPHFQTHDHHRHDLPNEQPQIHSNGYSHNSNCGQTHSHTHDHLHDYQYSQPHDQLHDNSYEQVYDNAHVNVHDQMHEGLQNKPSVQTDEHAHNHTHDQREYQMHEQMYDQTYIHPKDDAKPSVLGWDTFKTIPRPERQDPGLQILVRKVLKVVTIVVCFLVIWVGTLVHKATVLFATSQVENSYNYTCSKYHYNSTEYTRCFRDLHSDSSQNPSCIANLHKNYTLGSTRTYKLCGDIQVRWVWCLFLIICTADIFKFIRWLKNILFKDTASATLRALFVVLLLETLSMLGMCCFVFMVLPTLHSSVHGLALMTAVGVIPAFWNIINQNKKSRVKMTIMHIVAFILQLSGLIIWPVMVAQEVMPEFDSTLVWGIPLSLFLMSLPWCVNYCGHHFTTNLDKMGGRITYSMEIKDLYCSKKYGVVCVWKVVWLFICTIIFTSFHLNISAEELFNFAPRADCSSKITTEHLPGQRMDWVGVWLVNVAAGITSYFCTRAAAKVHIQSMAYAVPLLLVTPTLLAILMFGCNNWVHDNCAFHAIMPEYLVFDCRPYSELMQLVTRGHIWVISIWWLAQIWVTKDIWFQKNVRLAQTSKLFFTPLYEGVVHEQWLLYNRCPNASKQVQEETKQQADVQRERHDSTVTDYGPQNLEVPMIYVCATMWHETPKEMNTMLKSIFKLDKDQCMKKNNDAYNFEAHIFFDDCMNRNEDLGYTRFNYVVNDYVRNLVEAVHKAESIMYPGDKRVKPPEKLPTPYGGRLVWTMPGGNKIICHLKDKEKIKIKKRWSQVMYMYYFLGYKLHKQEKRKELAENIFLLALDGDVDFEPRALRLLVDIMKKDSKVGAACGRIHPTGSGPMVWYQKFEYAIGHWMQKATEHVLGSVLCSPGCFSLFRGVALMSDNVMHSYTANADEAVQIIQYDQGEDRWLCTLLLQQGWRVEYNAASDSFTMAPEEFNEFYNQRRRWTPSTMLNVIDLLGSWKNTIKVNESISVLYIIYQLVMFYSSLLGSGSIFLMMVGALSVAIHISLWWSLALNFVPLSIFVVLCLTSKKDVQLVVAYFLTVTYGLIQMLVLIAIIIQMSSEGPCSPTFIFFMYVAGTFILAAIMHPQEWSCIAHGLLYFVLIPSMYMLLMIYSLTNINDVSWGTREDKKTVAQVEQEQREKEEAEEKESKKDGSFRLKESLKAKAKDLRQNDDGWTIQVGNCCKFMLCPQPVKEDRTYLNIVLDTMQKMIRKLDKKNNLLLETVLEDSDDSEAVANPTSQKHTHKKISANKAVAVQEFLATSEDKEDDPETKKRLKEEEDERLKKQLEREEKEDEKLMAEDLKNPKWIEDEKCLGKCEPGELHPTEIQFFKDLIRLYLKPPKSTKESRAKEAKLKEGLTALKNKCSFGYIILNFTFVVVIFTMQQNRDMLQIPWVCGGLKLEPIGVMFLVFFTTIMFIQTVGMLSHRFGTFMHIVADTELTSRSTRHVEEDTMLNMADSPSIEIGMENGEVKDGKKSTTIDRYNANEGSPETIEVKVDMEEEEQQRESQRSRWMDTLKETSTCRTHSLNDFENGDVTSHTITQTTYALVHDQPDDRTPIDSLEMTEFQPTLDKGLVNEAFKLSEDIT